MQMKTLIFPALAVLAVLVSCSDGETYAEMKTKEKDAIQRFLQDNELVGRISPISEATFYAQDSTTDVSKNEFVLFLDDGIYMQVVRRGSGKTMVEMAKEQPDSTTSQTILCRFLEYDIENADTTRTNYYVSAVVDKMQCSYAHRGRSYTGSFTEGYMQSKYGSVVPEGWLKPLDFIRLTRNAGQIAKIRVIVPHSSGTSNAKNYVLPYYYEITYQLGR